MAIYWVALFVDFGVMTRNERVSLWVHAPTTVDAGEPFRVVVEAWDPYERLAGAYEGRVAFDLESHAFASGGAGIDAPGRATPGPRTSVSWGVVPVDGESAPTNGSGARFSSNFPWRGAWPAYKVAGADNGKKAFHARIDAPGIHYLHVVEPETGARYRSNPVVVRPAGSAAARVYWGDLHGHSYYSDGSGPPAEAYRFARDVALLDFAALTDHTEMFPRVGDWDVLDRFQQYKRIANDFNGGPGGNFTTLLALEWTPLLAPSRPYLSTAHVNVYFRGNDMPFFSTWTQHTQAELYAYLRARGHANFLSWPHHTTRSDYGSDFGFYDPAVNTMVEIYSCHGSSEFVGTRNLYPAINEFEGADRYSVNAGLQMGRRHGFMASSDTHDGRIGHNILHTDARAMNQYPFNPSAYRYGVPYPGGLTGVYASQLDRGAVFDALRARAGYATTWVNRHYLNFSINGVPVGTRNSTVTVPSATTPRTVELLVAADGIATRPNQTTCIETIEVFKNSELWRRAVVDQPIVRWRLRDETPVTGTSYDLCVQKADGLWYVSERSIQPVDPATLNTGGADYYYARVTDSNGGAAWIGPLWVEVAV